MVGAGLIRLINTCTWVILRRCASSPFHSTRSGNMDSDDNDDDDLDIAVSVSRELNPLAKSLSPVFLSAG